jgi:hypothetical protein
MSERLSPPDAHELTRSHLFVLRLWQENLGEGQVEWRGKVQPMAHGEAYYFRDWPGLITCLQQILGNQLGPTK